uniref:Protein kinase domain-containing protein n=1 Tax=Rhabditophanes sp. KR3021 TaxID=114890 RepID=A0AC35TXA2_9BILA
MFAPDSIEIKHYVIKFADNRYVIEKAAFETVKELVIYHEGQKEDINVAIKKLANLEKMKKEDIQEIMKEARLVRRVSPDRKLEFCWGVAFGIEYMHSLGMIHRDIACRNVLYADQVKLADFGQTEICTRFKMSPTAKVPSRWLAPKTIKQYYYTARSDVFAFGILAWEIYNDGKQPYGDMTAVVAAIRVAKTGYRMQLPDGMRPEMKDLINTKIWNGLDTQRATMKVVVDTLEKISSITRPGPLNEGRVAEVALTVKNAFGPIFKYCVNES